MRPSYLAISFDKGIWEPHHLAVAWIKHCIDHLSFANHLHQLKIWIKPYSRGLDYPALGDYEDLYRIIEPLHKCGSLKRVELGFLLNGSTSS